LRGPMQAELEVRLSDSRLVHDILNLMGRWHHDGDANNPKSLNNDLVGHVVSSLNRKSYSELSECLLREFGKKCSAFGKKYATPLDLRGIEIQQVEFIDASSGDARFDGARMHDVAWKNCRFSSGSFRHANLRAVKFVNCTFWETCFEGADLVVCSFGNCTFHGCDFRKCDLTRSSFPQSTLTDCIWRYPRGVRGTSVDLAAMPGTRGLERYIRDEQWIAELQQTSESSRVLRTALFFWRISSNYGRSFGLWFIWAVIVAIFFGVFYQFVPIGPAPGQTNVPQGWFTRFYFSVIAFTTLGFGDVYPQNTVAQILVMIEVLLGYLMLGGLVSILANKFARRA